MSKKKFFFEYDKFAFKTANIPVFKHRAFVCLTYACLGRIGEIVRSKYDPENTPIKKKDIREQGRHLIIKVLTEKRRIIRRIPINTEIEPWLTVPIINWANQFKDEEEPLFNWSTRWGEKIFEKYFGTQNIHLLRKWRATHLLQGHCTVERPGMEVVRKMGGWKNLKTLMEVYDSSVIEDYLEVI
ncbi:MAG: site-specific integrase [Thermodesulfovibrionia bacterium]|nr:site-specific integrase [Thermodesulfovibrionia bacterium]